MPKIDGVWRPLWSCHAKINGEWRDIGEYTGKIDGEHREIYRHEILESDINGFRLVYKLSTNKTHPMFPHLVTNRKLPVKFSVTGENPGMNTSVKGVLYQYDKTGYEEGILMYEGILYAVLNSGPVVNVCLAKDTKVNNDDERFSGTAPDMIEAWSTNKMSSLSIQLNGYLAFESYGYYMSGWNSLFELEHFTDPNKYPINDLTTDVQLSISRTILPINKRSTTYDNVASIGIARNLTTPDNNMIGSYGILDHTINSITVNDIVKPFTIEIYNN